VIIKFSITGIVIVIGREKVHNHGNFVAYIKAWWSRGTGPRDFHDKKIDPTDLFYYVAHT
jgi:hypothetical protein